MYLNDITLDRKRLSSEGYFLLENVQLQSVSTALTTLFHAANDFFCCPKLVNCCVRYLDENLNNDTVLEIYQHLRFYSTDLSATIAENDLLTFPSAPLLEEIENVNFAAFIDVKNVCSKSILQPCNSLLFNCYQYIDSHADEVLEKVEYLTKDALYDIVKRDSFGVSSETVLFSAIEKWCNRECNRLQLELTDENRKSIIGDRLLFSIRYLLMTAEEFVSGPMRSGLFEQSESALILGHILKHPDVADVSDVSNRISLPVLAFLKRARTRVVYAPKPLSTRTESKVTDKLKLQALKALAKKEKKKKKTDRKDTENKCLNFTLNVLASIFD